VTPEHQQVQVDLSRAPPFALLPPEGALEALERDQERGGAGRRIRPGRQVERDDRVPELRLVHDPDGSRRVQPRYAAEPRARQGHQRMDGRIENACRVADVRPQPDVRPHPAHGRSPLRR
jgi:hypothetical protein